MSIWQTIRDTSGNVQLGGLRTVLAIAGISVGCAAVVALLSIGESAAEASMQMFKGLGSDALVATFVDKDSSNPSALAASSEVLSQISHFTGASALAAVAPLSLTVIELRKKRLGTSAMVVGSTPELAEVLRLKAIDGRLLSSKDRRATRAMLGHDVAQRLALVSGVSNVAVTLELNGYLFEVIGVLAPQMANPMVPVAINDSIFIPLDSIGRIKDALDLSVVVAKAALNVDMAFASKSLHSQLAALSDRDVEVQIPSQLLDGMREQARAFSYLLSGVGAISLLVGGVGVMNVMLMNVMERKREIGLRMAVGARPRDIRTMFLMEALIVVLAGSIIGVLGGSFIAYCFAVIAAWPFVLALESILLGMAVSLCTGLVFGLYPAVSAARLQPVQALRDA